jgi:predicted anti-sigma-YlaC factor YlaD
MLSCQELTEVATDYLEDDLPWRTRLRVRIHLWMCSHCRRYLDQLRKVIGLLKGLPAQPLPPELIERLVAQFRQARDKPA